MRFLADENVASSVVENLRNAGHDVKDVKEEKLYGIADREILQLAVKEGRIIVTHDKDFIHVPSKINHRGIVLLRLQNRVPKNVAETLLRVLKSSLARKIKNRLVIVSESKVVLYKK